MPPSQPSNEDLSAFPSDLRRVWLTVAILSLLTLLFCAAGRLEHVSPLYYRVLSERRERFGDFTIYQAKFALFHTAAFFKVDFPFTYPAPVALVYETFIRLFGVHAVAAFVIFSALAVVVPAALFAQALRRRGIRPSLAFAFAGTLLLCSWPAILVIDRGNMEILVWIVLAAATWAFATGRRYLAASLFGVAAALKLFPFIFLALFLSMRRFKELALGAAVFFVLSVLSLAALGPSVWVAAHGIASGLHFFQLEYMAMWRPVENGVDHSMFATTKYLLITVFHHSPVLPFKRPLSIYSAVTVLGGIFLYFWRIRLLPLLNQLLILSIASIYFTAFSGDGTLFHLYYAFALLAFLAIDASRRGILVRGMRTALLLLAFILSYEAFFFFRGQRLEGEVKCLALGWLFVVALRYPFGPALGRAVPEDALAHPDASLVQASA